MLAQREGASTRTADELLLVFVHDAESIGAELSPWGQLVRDAAEEHLNRDDAGPSAWIDDEQYPELRDELVTLVDQLENSLATMDQPAYAWWDDGYHIVHIVGGPLADEYAR